MAEVFLIDENGIRDGEEYPIKRTTVCYVQYEGGMIVPLGVVSEEEAARIVGEFKECGRFEWCGKDIKAHGIFIAPITKTIYDLRK
jgi:hypothetical protein